MTLVEHVATRTQSRLPLRDKPRQCELYESITAEVTLSRMQQDNDLETEIRVRRMIAQDFSDVLVVVAFEIDDDDSDAWYMVVQIDGKKIIVSH